MTTSRCQRPLTLCRWMLLNRWMRWNKMWVVFFSRSQWILDFSTSHYCMSQCGCLKPNPAHGRWWVGSASRSQHNMDRSSLGFFRHSRAGGLAAGPIDDRCPLERCATADCACGIGLRFRLVQDCHTDTRSRRSAVLWSRDMVHIH